jgi:hypothetical protein
MDTQEWVVPVTQCECCGGPLRPVLYFHGKLWLRCQDCGHDQEAPRWP